MANPSSVPANVAGSIPPDQFSLMNAARARKDAFEFSFASENEHSEILGFLQSIFYHPDQVEFEHLLRQPRYEPIDRLLFRKGSDLAAHVQLCHRPLQWGQTTLPTIDLQHLAALQEYHASGLVDQLLNAIPTQVNLHGALLATMRTQSPEPMLRRGWIPWLRHCHSTTSPRQLLAELAEHAEEANSTGHDVRRWRRNELNAIRRLNHQDCPHPFGGTDRNEDDWKWLVERKGFDYIYVARPHDQVDELDGESIIGYAVIVDGNVVELCEQPGSNASLSLLTRVCRDAIDEGRHSVTAHASQDHPLHLWFRQAFGQTEYASLGDGGYLLAKILDPLKFLRHMRPILSERAHAPSANDLPIKEGVELGIVPRNGNHFSPLRIHVNRRRAAVAQTKPDPANSIAIGPEDLQRLLLGECSIDRLVAANRAIARSQQTMDLARVLFPEQNGWRPPWDDLPSRA